MAENSQNGKLLPLFLEYLQKVKTALQEPGPSCAASECDLLAQAQQKADDRRLEHAAGQADAT